MYSSWLDSNKVSGPYAPAVLRFNVSFPLQYPDLPPLVVFATDIFHPLLVPLTTYTFSTRAGGANETVSASDEDRLPPGGFSLRDGFPEWFGRQGRAAQEVIDGDGNRRVTANGSRDVSVDPAAMASTQEAGSTWRPSQEAAAKSVTIVEVLAYLKSTFEDPKMLDKIPLEAAGNPGAWHGWRSHRELSKAPSRATSPADDEMSNPPQAVPQTLPGNWNWEGVWQNRVKNGIENSFSDPVLFGPKGGRGGDKWTEVVSGTAMSISPVADHHRYDSPR